MTVNNTAIFFDDSYIGRYSEPTTITGKHTLYLKAQIYNPIKDKYESAESTFEYTVAEKPLIIRTPLQTVLYKGIQQPIYFRGLDETIQKVSSAGGKITTQKGDYFITPYAGDSLEVVLETKEETRIFVFKVKPLPYPTATLSNKISDGTVRFLLFRSLVANLWSWFSRIWRKNLLLPYCGTTPDQPHVSTNLNSWSQTVQLARQRLLQMHDLTTQLGQFIAEKR